MMSCSWLRNATTSKISSLASFRAARSCCAKERVAGSKSVFHFDVQGSLAKSTHAGIPWLRFIDLSPADQGLHIGPFRLDPNAQKERGFPIRRLRSKPV